MLRVGSALGLVSLLAAAPLRAQAPAALPQEPVVVASGEGTAQAAPDRAWISVSAESRALKRFHCDRKRLTALAHHQARWKAAHDFDGGLAETVDWFMANEWWWRPIRDGKYGGARLGSAA